MPGGGHVTGSGAAAAAAEPRRAARPSGSRPAPALLVFLFVSALAAQPRLRRGPGQPRAARPAPALQPGPGAMGAAAGRSAHLGPAPAGYRLRSLLLVQLLLLVWAPRATGTQGTEFPELCRWVALQGSGFARGALARGGRGWGPGRSGRDWGPGVASGPDLSPLVPEGKLPARRGRIRDRGSCARAGGRGGRGVPPLIGVRRQATCGCH